MPELTSQNYGKNPFATPEPHFLPGYTGHCPQYKVTVGQTYGHATYAILKQEELPAGRRLKPIPEDGRWSIPPNVNKNDEVILEERKQIMKDTVLTKDIAPGYKGHVPRASQTVGLTFNQSCLHGLADFEKRRRELDKLLHSETKTSKFSVNDENQ